MLCVLKENTRFPKLWFPHRFLSRLQESRKAVALDIKYDGEGMNILSSAGFLQHLYQVCRLPPGSGALVAPVCSTFVFMSLSCSQQGFGPSHSPSSRLNRLGRSSANQHYDPSTPRSKGTTKRSAIQPEGDVSAPSVRAGNKILCRTLVLLFVCAALQVWWILEQPKGSCMEDHPAFQYFMRQVTTFRHYMTMGEYGGPTQKPTWLYSGSYLTFVYVCFYFFRS